MKKSRVVKKRTMISEKTKDNIIKYFKTNKDNQAYVIAIKFNLSEGQVSNIINKYIKTLTINPE
jgi:DNA-directed RNA polymerase specialized sigma subunit